LAYEGRSDEVENLFLSHPLETEVRTNRSRSYTRKNRAPQVKDFFNTACFIAVECGHTKAVEVLLDNGVDANLKNFHGQPLLHHATFRKKQRAREEHYR